MSLPAESNDSYQRDLQLQKAILAGWASATELQEAHHDPLYRKLHSMKDSKGRSDLVEEAAVRTLAQVLDSSPAARGTIKNWKGTNKDGEAASLGGYLFAIAKNKLNELLKRETQRGAGEDDMEFIETCASSSPMSNLAERIPAALLASLAHKISNQGKEHPRLLVLEHLTALGVMQVNAAKLWAWDKTYASPQIAKLQPPRLSILKQKAGNLPELPMLLQQILVSNPEMLTGRALGMADPSPQLTDAEHRELRDIAATAIDNGNEAELARLLWKKKEILADLFSHFSTMASKAKVSLDDIVVGKVPEDRQRGLCEAAGRLEKNVGAGAFREELGRVLELLIQRHKLDAGTLDDERSESLTRHFSQLMAATRWQDRLWQDEAALDCLARAMSTTRRGSKSRRPPPVPQHEDLRGKGGLLQRELSRAADMLLPMDFAHHIDEGCRAAHTALLKASQATGATLWLVNTELRQLQAVFNPAEEGEAGIVGQLQPLNAGIISWVHQTRRGVYFTRTSGVSGHPGNHRPYSHSGEIDRRLGKTTSAMIVIPFECCGAGRGVLSLVRAGSPVQAFTSDERQLLEGLAKTLATSIEKSLIMQILE